MSTLTTARTPTTADPSVMDKPVAQAKTWLSEQRAAGTLVGEETAWREAYGVYLATLADAPEQSRASTWACMASELVFERGGVPLNQRTAAREACQFLVENPGLPLAERARKLQALTDAHNVDPWKVRALLEPGLGCPWIFPRTLWTRGVVARGLEAILASFPWSPGSEPDEAWLAEHGIASRVGAFLSGLKDRAPEGSDLARMVGAAASFVQQLHEEGKDLCVVEPKTFITALAYHGLSEPETVEWYARLLALREGIILLRAFQLYHRAEGYLIAAEAEESDPESALEAMIKAANIYKRLCVAEMYPERLLARHGEIWRRIEEHRAEWDLPDDRSEHVLLVSTFNSPADLQRLLLSVTHELMLYSYGRPVHVVLSDDSAGELRSQNQALLAEAERSGLRVSDWSTERRSELFARLNDDVFPDGSFDVADLVGPRQEGEKGVPYGRLRNFLRLAGLSEVREHGLEDPVFTWLDQDNELGALVLNRNNLLSKRHVFNYFDQKSSIFDDPQLLVGGGGYTNDALEGVEKFWVAWGILHNALGLAEDHAPHGSSILAPAADITRFRPWDQPDTLERLPREGEDVETMSDQFLLLLQTLVGTFRGKYDNQVQLYHPWTYGEVDPDDERVIEERRAFAGMPGGNTSFVTDVLASSIPFITVGGRGEDIFHLWQLEGSHGPGRIFLTHTPILHTRNVNAGRGDLMSEIIDSYNGRIFREPPYIWSALSDLFDGGSDGVTPDVEAQTSERIDGLRAEAKASIAAVSGFAAALEPYLDESSHFWWLERAKGDPRCADVLATLRGVVSEFKDVAKYHRLADEKLMHLEDVKELTDQFIAAYPHWETVVEHVGGSRPGAGEGSALATGPREGYGSELRAAAQSSGSGTRRPALGPPVFVDPVEAPPWQEVLTSSLLLFRRYEQGLAEKESWLEWPERVRRLRSIYRHYTAPLDEVPEFLWTRLFRDALFVPHSAPYRALTAMVADDFWRLDGAGREAEVSRLADEYDVDRAWLAEGLLPEA